MLYFELNEEERKEADKITREMHSKLSNFLLPFFDYSTGENLPTQEEWIRWRERMDAIQANAHKRAIEYFSYAPLELFAKLKEETRGICALLAMLELGGQNLEVTEDMKAKFKEEIAPYLDILKEKKPRKCGELIKFINSAFEHRAELAREEQDKQRPLLERAYVKYAQDNMTNEFINMAQLKESRGDVKKVMGELRFQQGDTILKIPHYEELLRKGNINEAELSTPVKKVFDIAVLSFTHTHDRLVKFTVEDYMRLCGINDEQKARKQIDNALELLFDMTLSYDDSAQKNKRRNYMDMRVIDKKGMTKGVVELHFVEDFANALIQMPKMPYSLRILQASKGREHRNSFYLARKILTQLNMNLGKKNERIFSVKSLLENAPFLATEEEVKKSDRHFDRRIITPFISDIEEALEILGIGKDNYEWHYAGGRKIPFQELEALEFDTFINAYLHIDKIPDYPELAVMENKEEHRKEALKAKRKKEKSQKDKTEDSTE